MPFKLKKNISEHFWRIFQILICDLVWVVNVVNIQKNVIWAQRLFFSNFLFRFGFLLSFYPIPELDLWKYIQKQKNFNLYPEFQNPDHCASDALCIPKEWSRKMTLIYFFVCLIKIYKMSYRNLMFLVILNWTFFRPFLTLGCPL